MTLDAGYASSATEDESRESRNGCKNPTHSEPPFVRLLRVYIDGSVGRLKGGGSLRYAPDSSLTEGNVLIYHPLGAPR